MEEVVANLIDDREDLLVAQIVEFVFPLEVFGNWLALKHVYDRQANLGLKSFHILRSIGPEKSLERLMADQK